MRVESADGRLDAPVRPSVPPLAWFALAQFAGVLAAEALAWGALEDGCAWLRTAGLLAGVAAAVLGVRLRRRGALALCAWGVALGLLSGIAFWTSWLTDGAAALADSGRRVVEVTGDARSGTFGAVSAGRLGRSEVDIEWPRQSPPAEAGERVALFARAIAPKHDPAGRRSHQAGVVASLRTRRVTKLGATPGPQGWALPLRLWALRRVDAVPGTGGDLLAGVLLGDRRRLADTPADDDFRTCGLTHLVAVSGGHLAVVAACAVWALSLMRAGPRTRASVVGVLCGGYVALTGVQSSAVRSWIMALALTWALASGRRGDALAALCAAAALMMALDPSCAFDLGFRLSVVSVAALVAFARLTAVWLTAALPRPGAGLAPPLAASLTAQAATTPLSAAVFGALSLVAPLANLLAGPAVALAIVVGGAALALAALAPPLGALLLKLAGAILAITAAVAAHLAAWPFAAVPVAWVPVASAAALTAAAALWVVWPAPSRRLARGAAATGLAAALALFALPSTAPPELVVLDVGQGDAILVRDGRHAVLVDSGPSAVRLRQALARHRVRHLDAAIASHLHADHVAGFKGLEGLVRADAMFVPPGCEPAELARTLPAAPRPQPLAVGDTVNCGTWRLRVVWPPPGRDPNENDGCLVLLAERPGVRVLLTGDAESDVLGELKREQRLSDVDVLKVGHHGSSDAVSADALAALRPEVAIISVGEGNRFGHPRQDTLDILGAAHVPVWRTDVVGEITIRPAKAGIRLIPQRRARYNASAANSETEGPYVLGKKARLRPLRCRGSPHRSRRGEHQSALRRRGGPRLQPDLVRRRQRLG